MESEEVGVGGIKVGVGTSGVCVGGAVGVDVDDAEVAVGAGTSEGLGEATGCVQAARRAADRMKRCAAEMACFIWESPENPEQRRA
jgi:hypothetical protein